MQWIHGFKHTRGFQAVVGGVVDPASRMESIRPAESGITDLSIIHISEMVLRSVLGAKRRECPNVQEPSPLRSEGTTKEYENPPLSYMALFNAKKRKPILLGRNVVMELCV